MRKLFLLLLSIVALRAGAIEIDSAQRNAMIREGQSELCSLVEYNSHATTTDQKKFLVVIDGNPNGINYTYEKHIDSLNDPILQQVTVDSINAVLARAYANYGVEMYVIMIRSFNIAIKTPLPEYPSGADLFTHHLYDEQSNINELRAIHARMSYEIIYSTFSARGRDCIVYSQANYTGMLTPGKVGSWQLSKQIPYYASNETYPKLDELMHCLYDRTINNSNVGYNTTNGSLLAVSREFYESAKYLALKGQILTTLHTDQMSAIFAQFDETVDYKNLTEPERIHALGVFAGFSMYDNGIGQQERYACKIIEATPKEQVADFLEHLAQESPLNTAVRFIGDKPNQALINSLIDHVDDVGFGDDNYARMMRGLTTLALSDQNFVSTHLPQSDQEWFDRRMYWDDWSIKPEQEIGTHDYDIVLNSDATLAVETRVVDRLIEDTVGGRQGTPKYEAHWDSYTAINLNPFDLVVFTNRSDLGMLQVAGAAPDQPFLAPAIFLKYADDKAFNANTVKTTAVALSVLGTITGPGAILSAVEAGNVALALFEGLQFVGAVADVSANAAASSQLTEAVNTFNLIVNTWGLSRIAVSGAKYTVGYITDVKTNTIGPVDMATANLYCTRYDAVNDWGNVSEATKEEMGRMRGLLGKQVAAGNAVTLLADMISQRKNFWEEWITKCFPGKNWSLSTFTTEGKSYDQFKLDRPLIYNDMRAINSNESKLAEMIESGSTYPVKVNIHNGDQFYKIVPKGGNINGPSIYYVDATQLNTIKSNPQNLEQILGLPLGSAAEEYDVFTITYTGNSGYIFQSTVATTEQFANATPNLKYSTSGGATQTLILNNSDQESWIKSLSPTESISPNQLPSIGNQQ